MASMIRKHLDGAVAFKILDFKTADINYQDELGPSPVLTLVGSPGPLRGSCTIIAV